MEMSEVEAVEGYVEELSQALHGWDPLRGSKGQLKRGFVDALTEIAALPPDSVNMEARRLLVGTAIEPMLVALTARDVPIKCKAANAIGSICMSRVAGLQLLYQHGESLLSSLIRMATCKNEWATADALFVFGWLVLLVDADQLDTIASLMPHILATVQATLTQSSAPSEPTSNYRIYAFVLLLNWSQRDASYLVQHLHSILSVLHTVMDQLVSPEECFEASERVELMRLTCTLLSVLIDQIDDTVAIVLELKMLPSLLKLKKLLRAQDSIETTELSELEDRLEVCIQAIVK